jgi:hypothetical protein
MIRACLQAGRLILTLIVFLPAAANAQSSNPPKGPRGDLPKPGSDAGSNTIYTCTATYIWTTIKLNGTDAGKDSGYRRRELATWECPPSAASLTRSGGGVIE